MIVIVMNFSFTLSYKQLFVVNENSHVFALANDLDFTHREIKIIIISFHFSSYLVKKLNEKKEIVLVE